MSSIKLTPRRAGGLALAVFLATGLSGCAESQTHLSTGFGEAVHQDIVAQISDPDARYKGDPAPGSDGARVAGAEDRYRAGKVTPPVSAAASIIGAVSSTPQ